MTSLLKFAMARETTAALINCGRAPTMVTIFMIYEPTTTNPLLPFSYFFSQARHSRSSDKRSPHSQAQPICLAGLPTTSAIVGNIFIHHRAGADEAVTPKCCTADNCGIGTDSGSFFYQCGAHLIHFADFSSAGYKYW